jgi:predicted SAM-dependent methyltransferase
MSNAKQYLKRSQFALGLVRTSRGLSADLRTIAWVAKRNSKITEYLRKQRVRKLQVGTSNNVLEGWLNTDIHPNHPDVIYMDATRRFPFYDNEFDYIIGEHMIEHVDYDAAQTMLRECFRVLRPGGKVRFATPDLRVLLSLHVPEKSEAQKIYIDWSSERFLPGVQQHKDVFVINNFFRAWGHSFLYDSETLAYALRASGFAAIKSYGPGLSDDPNLMDLESHGKEIQDESINQFETIVVEGQKLVNPERIERR